MLGSILLKFAEIRREIEAAERMSGCTRDVGIASPRTRGVIYVRPITEQRVLGEACELHRRLQGVVKRMEEAIVEDVTVSSSIQQYAQCKCNIPLMAIS